MANITANLTGASLTLAATTAPSTNVVALIPGTVTMNGNVSSYEAYLAVASGGTSIMMPTTTVFCVWVRNLGASNIQMICTPAGGSAWVSPLVINPGGIQLYIQKGTPGIGGISAMTLTSDIGTGAAEVFLAG